MSKPCKIALMNYTESNKKGTETSMMEEVGMAGSKSTLSKFVGIITSVIHPYTLAF